MNSLLTPEQVAGILNCKTSSVYSWVHRGKIPAYKVNGLLRFKADEIQEIIENSRVKQKPPLKIRTRKLSNYEIDEMVKTAIESVKGSCYNSPDGKKSAWNGPERRR